MHSDEEDIEGVSNSSGDYDDDDDDLEGGDTDKVMTFVPTEDAGEEDGGGSKKKSRKQKKADKQANQEDWEVPQETLKRLREEKRAEKKKSKRSRSDVDDSGSGEKKNSDLELLFAGDEDSEEEGRDRLNFTKKQLAVAEDLKHNAAQRDSSSKIKKISKSKAKLLAEKKTGDEFELDMNDNRFSKVLEGDADYGIDRLSNEYRPTAAMEMILNERNNRKIAAEKDCTRMSSVRKADTIEETAPISSNKLSSLANKLKKNFNK